MKSWQTFLPEKKTTLVLKGLNHIRTRSQVKKWWGISEGREYYLPSGHEQTESREDIMNFEALARNTASKDVRLFGFRCNNIVVPAYGWFIRKICHNFLGYLYVCIPLYATQKKTIWRGVSSLWWYKPTKLIVSAKELHSYSGNIMKFHTNKNQLYKN